MATRQQSREIPWICLSPMGLTGPDFRHGQTFLRNHAEEVASIDLFVVRTVAFEQLFGFLVLGHGRRRLIWSAITAHPTAEWLARQITEAFPWDEAPKYLIRDNDRAFGSVFKAASERWASGIGRPRPAPPAERLC